MRQVFECLCSLDGRRICGHEQVLRLNLISNFKIQYLYFTILILFHLIGKQKPWHDWFNYLKKTRIEESLQVLLSSV
jgi:hypothetical protein